MGNAHYVAAVAAVALNDYPVAQSELALFLQEDPANPLAPTARYNLDILSRSQQKAGQVAGAAATSSRRRTIATNQPQNLANSDRLQSSIGWCWVTKPMRRWLRLTARRLASAAETAPVLRSIRLPM